MKNPVFERAGYAIEIEPVWSCEEGRIGIEIGDVQDSLEGNDLPLHVTCSVREFWIQIPETNIEVNILINGVDLSLELLGAAISTNTQIGRETNPYTYDIGVEYLGENKSNSESNMEGSVNTKSLKDLPSIGINLLRKKESIKSDNLKNFYTSKIIKTRISYIPSGYWHIRACDSDEKFHFSGTVLSDIVCKINGLNDIAEFTANLSVGPENVSSTRFRDVLTAENIESKTLPLDYIDKSGRGPKNISNIKLAVMQALIKKGMQNKKNIIIASHKIKYTKSGN